MTDQEDFAEVLREFGLTAEQMKEAVRLAPSFPMTMRANADVEVDVSEIEGVGVFARREFVLGAVIAVARLGQQWTFSGRYTNHAREPNARARREGVNLIFIANRPVRKGEEITVDYRQVRHALESQLQPMEVAS